MHKLITNDKTRKDTELWGWELSLLGVKLHEIQSCKAITSAIKKNQEIRD